jgi:hypothetical protein
MFECANCGKPITKLYRLSGRNPFTPTQRQIYRFWFSWSLFYPFYTSDPEQDAKARAMLAERNAE